MNTPARQPKVEPLRQRVREQAEQTYRSAILDAAEQVFVSQGFSEARMADIAQAIEVSVGTLYNYFESKEAVFASLLDERQREFQEVIAAAVGEPSADPPALHLLHALLGHIEQRGALMVLFTQLGAVSENDVRRIAGPQGDNCYQQYLGQLTACIARSVADGQLRGDIEPRRLASSLAGAVNASIFDWLHAGRPAGLPERGSEVYRLFVEGAEAR